MPFIRTRGGKLIRLASGKFLAAGTASASGGSGNDDTGVSIGVPGMGGTGAGGSNTGGGTMTPPSNSSYAPLSDITVTPNQDAYSTAWNTSGDNWKPVGLEFFPVGGTGPFVFSLQNAGDWSITGDTNGGRNSISNKGWIVVPGTATSATSTITLVVKDALGATASKAVTIPSSTVTGPAIIVGNNRTWSSNITPAILAFFTDGSGNNSPISSVTDPAGFFVADGYTSITTANGGPVPAGTYPLTVYGGGISRQVTIRIQQAVMGGIVLVEQASVVSTSVLRGWKVFRAIGTTPGNTAVYSIDATGSKYIMGSSSGIVTVLNAGNLTVGTDSITLHQTEGTSSTNLVGSVSVQQGTTLDASHMAITLDKPFTNYAFLAQKTKRPVSSNPPVLSGFPSGASVSWYVSAVQRFNWTMDNPFEASLRDYDVDMRGGVGGGYPRFGCDPSTGLPYVQAALSDTTGTPGEWFELTATTGLMTCTKRCFLQVAPVIGPKLYVGPNAAPAGFTKVATLQAALAPLNNYPDVNVSAYAGTEVRVEYDPANPNRYVNDWEQNYEQAKRDYLGPLTITGIPGANGELPYYGGGANSSASHRAFKALICMNDGDLTVTNMALGDQHMGVFGGNYLPASNQTMSLIRRNGGTSGDIKLTNVDLHDADVPLECGNTDGQWVLKNIRIYNGSGCTSGGGANQHNAYLGMCWNVTADNVLSYNAANGHIFKLRSANSTWTNSRFFDSERGSGFNAMDLPCGGTHSFTKCRFEKAPAAENPYLIQFGEEVPGELPFTLPTQDYVNALSFDQCTFTLHATNAILGNGDRGFAMLSFVGRIAPNTGVPATLSITNSVFEGYSSSQVVAFGSNTDPGHDFSTGFTQSGNTFSSTWSAMDFTNPVSYGAARPGWHNSVAQIGGSANQNFPYFNARQIDPGVDEIRIPHNAAPGTLVCTLKGYGCDNWSLSPNPQPDPRIAPFVAGSQWTAGQTTISYTGVPFGYANASYVFNTLADGTGEVRVGANGLGPAGLDVILPRGTSPASTGSLIVENPFFVVKT